MTIEKKKKIKITLLSVLILLCVCFAVCALVPALRQRVLRIPLKTEELFPMPDEIVCHYNGESYTFTSEQIEELYKLFLDVVPNIEDCVHAESQEWVRENFEWEFCYDAPYRYVGHLGTEEPLCEEPFVFDNLLMSRTYGLCYGISFEPFYNGTACDLYNGQYSGISFSNAAPLAYFLNRMEQFVMRAHLGGSVWSVENTDTLVGNTFPAKPDSIFVYQDGRSTVLTGEELDVVYGVFANAAQVGYSMHEQSIPKSGDMIDAIQDSTCIEFRYNRRQQFVSDQPESDLQYHVSLRDYYHNRQYDAILFIWGEGTNGSLRVAPYHNGYYNYADMVGTPWSWSGEDEALDSLETYVRDLLP